MKADATQLSKSEATRIANIRQSCLDRIDKAKGSMVDGVIAIGAALAEIQETCQPKEFVPWVQEHCKFEKSTAYNYIKVSKRFGKCKRLENFEASGLYVLVVCEPAAERAIALASKGQYISFERAKEIVGEVKAAEAASNATDDPSDDPMVIDEVPLESAELTSPEIDDDETTSDDSGEENDVLDVAEIPEPKRPKPGAGQRLAEVTQGFPGDWAEAFDGLREAIVLERGRQWTGITKQQFSVAMLAHLEFGERPAE
jgi:hypothetical protein